MIGLDDFSKIWAGPRALLVGADPYDPATWSATAVGLGTFLPDTPVYLYPPWVALLLVPLAAMPQAVAAVLWSAGGIAAAGVALRALLRSALPGRPYAHATVAVTLLLSGPGISALLSGQWSFLLIAAVTAIVLLLRAERPISAGVASLAMLTKPQLFLYAAPALALHALWPDRSGRALPWGRRYVLTAVAGGGALVAASQLLMPGSGPTWLIQVGEDRLLPESVTIPGLLFRTLGEAGLVLAPVVLVLFVLLALRSHPRGEAWLPVWLSLTIAATPYSNPYDLLLLIVPLVLAAEALARASPRRATLLFYAGSAILLVAATALHAFALLAFAPLVPTAMFLLILAALWGRGGPAAAAASP